MNTRHPQVSCYQSIPWSWNIETNKNVTLNYKSHQKRIQIRSKNQNQIYKTLHIDSKLAFNGEWHWHYDAPKLQPLKINQSGASMNTSLYSTYTIRDTCTWWTCLALIIQPPDVLDNCWMVGFASLYSIRYGHLCSQTRSWFWPIPYPLTNGYILILKLNPCIKSSRICVYLSCRLDPNPNRTLSLYLLKWIVRLSLYSVLVMFLLWLTKRLLAGDYFKFLG